MIRSDAEAQRQIGLDAGGREGGGEKTHPNAYCRASMYYKLIAAASRCVMRRGTDVKMLRDTEDERQK